MYNIVDNFGTLCRKILVSGNQQNELQPNKTTRKVPNETTRIEVDQIPNNLEQWTEEQNKILKELVRRAIFIEMEFGRGRRTLGPTWRWQLRRIYCPSFGVGLAKNTSLKWNVSDLKFFLTNPKEKCEYELKKWKEAVGRDENGRQKLKQLNLYDASKEGIQHE